MVGEAFLPSNAYYPRTPDYTLYSGVHVCWSEHSDSSFVYGFMSLDYGLVQSIFCFLWDHWAHCSIFENGVLLMYTLEGVSSVANFITAYEESQ